MSTDRDPTRVVLSWLRADEHVSADQILDEVLTAVDTTPQRRSSWLARRTPTMNKFVGFGLAAAAVIIVAFISIQLVGGPSVLGPGPTDTPPPSPTPVSTPSPSGSSVPALNGQDPLAAGRYQVDADSYPVELTVEVPAGWIAGGTWVTQGPKLAQVALKYGLNDFGSTMMEENVVSPTGTNFLMQIDEIRRLIREAGYEPRVRDTLYNFVD